MASKKSGLYGTTKNGPILRPFSEIVHTKFLFTFNVSPKFLTLETYLTTFVPFGIGPGNAFSRPSSYCSNRKSRGCLLTPSIIFFSSSVNVSRFNSTRLVVKVCLISLLATKLPLNDRKSLVPLVVSFRRIDVASLIRFSLSELGLGACNKCAFVPVANNV